MKLNYIAKLVLVFAVLIIANTNLKSQLCSNEILLDGSETLVSYGMDTTKNWWALTAPFTSLKKLYVNGHSAGNFESVNNLSFSPSGDRYAYFGYNSQGWHLITEDTTLQFNATDPGFVAYSYDSEVMAYSYFYGDLETIRFGNKKIEAMHRTGDFFLNQDGSRYAFVLQNGSYQNIIINGKESTSYDEIKPVGFWQDGKFVYAARSGSSWTIFKNEIELSENLAEVHEAKINARGSICAFLVRLQSGKETGMTISDEYYEPLMGKNYDMVANLRLHPEEPMIAYTAVEEPYTKIVLNSAEYATSKYSSKPEFSYNGDDLYFLGCDLGCFISINGRQYPIKQVVAPDLQIAKKPNSNTIAYSTNSSMVVLFIENGNMHSDIMLDSLIAPRYNHFDDVYETLGVINNRLYRLRCKTK